MSRFKAPVQPKAGARPTVNLAGGSAYDRDPKTALASMVLTSLVCDTYYQASAQALADVQFLASKLANAGELEFVAKTAIFARHTYGLRSISHVLAGMVASFRFALPEQRGTWGPAFFDRIVFRADDMAEIASYWIGQLGEREKKTLPNAMKRGFARAFARIRPEEIAKWNGASTRSMTLRHLAHMVHPSSPKDSPLWKLRGGTLESADTHETAMTKAGQGEDAAETKASEWVRLFSEGKVKYLAALRNARRILEQAPNAVDLLIERLVSEKDIRASKVLPFQFLAAHDAVSAIPGPRVKDVLAAIETGAELALANIPKLEGATLVALDDSGSMHDNAAERHKKAAVIGAMFAAALAKSGDTDIMLFSDDAKYASLSAKATLFGAIEKLLSQSRPCGTNFNAPFAAAKRAYRRVILLSDAQGWMGSRPGEDARWMYGKCYGCDPIIYSWDLVGSTTAQFPEKRVALLAGFSDKALDLMAALEQDPKATVHAIEATRI